MPAVYIMACQRMRLGAVRRQRVAEQPTQSAETGSAATGTRRGFTLVELAVLLAMAVVLLAIFIPYIRYTREYGHRVTCMDHLRQINAALRVYAADNSGMFPRVVHDTQAASDGWTAFTGSDDPDPFSESSAVRPNDVTASLWLLVRGGLLEDTGVFICPSTDDRRDPLTDSSGQQVGPGKRGNFRSRENLSYSYAHPFSTAPDYRLNEFRDPYFVLLADRNPGRAGGYDVTAVKWNDGPSRRRWGNSRNHGGVGQSVLFASGVVEFVDSPFVGARHDPQTPAGDNIYTALVRRPTPTQLPPLTAPGVIGEDVGPAWANDSFLVPYEK